MSLDRTLGAGRRLAVGTFVAGIGLTILAAPVAAALRANTIVADPLILTQGNTKTVDLTVTNVGSGGGGEEIGCVTVQVPGAFDTLDASIAAAAVRLHLEGVDQRSVRLERPGQVPVAEGSPDRWNQAGASRVPGARHADGDRDEDLGHDRVQRQLQRRTVSPGSRWPS